MAKTARQKEFERDFRGHIERHRPALLKALGRIISTKLPAVVKVLSFEVFSHWDEFPVNVFAMDNQAPNEVYFKAPFSGELLKRVGALIPEGAIDQDAFEDDGVATYETGARVLAEWFGKCWYEAGGAKFPIPAYIGHHDSSAQYDLRKKRWVKFSEIWP